MRNERGFVPAVDALCTRVSECIGDGSAAPKPPTLAQRTDEVFKRYAGNAGRLDSEEEGERMVDIWMYFRRGKLPCCIAAALARLLRDYGVEVEGAGANRAVELLEGPGASSVGFESFCRLVANATEKFRGYSEEEIRILRQVFYAYDANDSGLLEAYEYSKLLADVGHAPRTKVESERLGALIASCRDGGCMGPLTFDEFLRLASRIDMQDSS